MAIEQIIKRIREEASKEADSYISDAKSRAGKIRAESDRELSKDLEERNRVLQRDLENTRNIYISDGKRKSRQAMLSSKEELIWDAICEIRKAIKDLPEEVLRNHLTRLLEDSRNILGDSITIYPVRMIDGELLKGSGQIGPLVSESIGSEPQLARFRGVDLLGGFIVVGPEGQKVLDMTFHGIIERNEERLRETIARTLFQ